MGEGEPGGDLSSLKGNSMTLLIRFKKGGHGTSLFLLTIVGSTCLPAGRNADANHLDGQL